MTKFIIEEVACDIATWLDIQTILFILPVFLVINEVVGLQHLVLNIAELAEEITTSAFPPSVCHSSHNRRYHYFSPLHFLGIPP